jgi:putative Mn2+ efflux pump MntP
VKNWVVGLVSASIVSGYAAKLPWWTYLLLLLIVGAFYLFEQLQHYFQEAYSLRVIVLERELRRSSKLVFSDRHRVHYHKVKNLSTLDPTSPSNAIYLLEMQLKRSMMGKLVLETHKVFYVVLCLFIIIAAVVSYSFAESKPTKAAKQVKMVKKADVVKNEVQNHEY